MEYTEFSINHNGRLQVVRPGEDNWTEISIRDLKDEDALLAELWRDVKDMMASYPYPAIVYSLWGGVSIEFQIPTDADFSKTRCWFPEGRKRWGWTAAKDHGDAAACIANEFEKADLGIGKGYQVSYFSFTLNVQSIDDAVRQLSIAEKILRKTRLGELVVQRPRWN